MDLIDARVMAIAGMKKWGLLEKGWAFEFDRATSRLGLTNFTQRKITISKYFTGAATAEQFEQTLLHEIAHAMLPPHSKHGPLWKSTARNIGYKGERTSRNPYYEQRMAERKAAATAGALNRQIRSTVAAHKPDAAIQVGDILLLPTGVKAKVQKVSPDKVVASELATGTAWNLSASAAHQFLAA